MPSLNKKLRKSVDRGNITIVSGLPRSGTSLMMQMCEAGGLELLTDNKRKPDQDNPKGYYEFEQVKKLESNNFWLSNAKGKVVKVISALLKHLSPEYSYKIIFMMRNIEEILASQKQMLIRRGEPTDKVSDEELAEMYRNHLQRIKKWLDEQPNFEVLYVNYNEVLNSPLDCSKKINAFFGNKLDDGKMSSIVDTNLYRQSRKH